MLFRSAIGMTVIVARYAAYVTGTDAPTAQSLLAQYGGSPLDYGSNGRAIASVVFIWPGMIATFASTFLLWRSLTHINKYGPKSAHARTRDDVSKDVQDKEARSEEPSIANEPSATVAPQTGVDGRKNSEPGYVV